MILKCCAVWAGTKIARTRALYIYTNLLMNLFKKQFSVHACMNAWLRAWPKSFTHTIVTLLLPSYKRELCASLVPGLLRGEGGRPGIHCMCMRCYYSDSGQSVHVCMDTAPCNLTHHAQWMVGLVSSNFEWDFKITWAILSINGWRPLNSVGTCLAWSLVQRSGSHPVFFRHMDHFTC